VSAAEIRARYLTWGEYGPGVYQTQVVDLVALLASRIDIELLALVTRRTRRRAAPPTHGAHLNGPLAGRNPLLSHFLRSRDLERVLTRTPSPGVLHCRGPLAAHVGLNARASVPGWRVLHDYRGLDAVELEETDGPSRLSARVARLERTACRAADFVSVVSEPLARIVVDEYGVPSERVVVTPTAARVGDIPWDNSARASARAALGIQGATAVLMYTGSAAWQLPDICIKTAARLAAGGVTLVVLSQDAPVFERLAHEAGLTPGALIVRSATAAEVSRLLCAGDLALLPRAPSRVNAVAAPVKYAEYLAAGLPVVTVRGAGPFAEEIDFRQLGATASSTDPGALAEAARSILTLSEGRRAELRSRCRAIAAERYDLDRVADRYEELYRLMLDAD
jgi:glycosyltransferase involved in cell wall biosynthesis